MGIYFTAVDRFYLFAGTGSSSLKVESDSSLPSTSKL